MSSIPALIRTQNGACHCRRQLGRSTPIVGVATLEVGNVRTERGRSHKEGVDVLDIGRSTRSWSVACVVTRTGDRIDPELLVLADTGSR